MLTLKFVDTLRKTAVISLDSITLTKSYYHDVQVELLQHHIKFHPDELKSVQENEAQRFWIALTLQPSANVKVSESGITW